MSDEILRDEDKETILPRPVVDRLDRTFGFAAGLALLLLMAVVTVDVVGRYLFAAPLRGGFEYVKICMALLVFLALPVIVAREEHIQVDVFEGLVPRRLRYFTRFLGFVISLAVVTGLIWVCYLRASSFYASGEQFVLFSAPLYPIAYFIFAIWVICAAIMLVQLFRYPKLARRSEDNQ
jgi:TRAP-type transport system small permease protein